LIGICISDHIWSLEGIGGIIGSDEQGSRNMISEARLFALAVAWVGGWGFLFFTYPQLICRFGRVKNPTPKRLRIVKVTGAVELAIVFTSCVLTALFGLPSN
jgi:hypothetical protein